MFANSHVGNGGIVEMVNFANFGETYTDNVWLHGVNYTVSEIEEPKTDPPDSRQPNSRPELQGIVGLHHSFNFSLQVFLYTWLLKT
jgi:hypothetical protein